MARVGHWAIRAYSPIACLPVRAIGGLAAAVLLMGTNAASSHGDTPRPTMDGVCYATWQQSDIMATRWSDERLAEVRDLGANWVALRVTWVQDAYNTTRIQPGFQTQSDEAYAHAVKRCHDLGMKVMVALIVDFKDPSRGGAWRWRGQIDPESAAVGSQQSSVTSNQSPVASGQTPAAGSPTPPHSQTPTPPYPPGNWGKWFRSYERFAVTYANRSQEWGADAFCLGTEMTSATAKFEKPWREIIRKVRDAYKGPVTYQANWSPLTYNNANVRGPELLRKNTWNAEYRTVKFWDALDYASLCAYFSLSAKPSPSQEELDAGLAEWREDVRAWQKTVGKPVIFTEVGYQSADRGATEPWQTPLGTPANPALQARCFEAFFRVLGTEPWVAGVFLWVVCPPDEGGMDPKGTGYVFLGKPAEEVVRRWFKGASAKSEVGSAK